MTALALTAVGGTRRETSVALSANLLVAVVLAGEHLERGLDDTTTQTEHKVEGRFLLDVVVREGAAILELLTGEDQALLVGGNTLLVLNLGLDIVDGVRGLHLKGNGLTCWCVKRIEETRWNALACRTGTGRDADSEESSFASIATSPYIPIHLASSARSPSCFLLCVTLSTLKVMIKSHSAILQSCHRTVD